jgi:hypothetical protein
MSCDYWNEDGGCYQNENLVEWKKIWGDRDDVGVDFDMENLPCLFSVIGERQRVFFTNTPESIRFKIGGGESGRRESRR